MELIRGKMCVKGVRPVSALTYKTVRAGTKLNRYKLHIYYVYTYTYIMFTHFHGVGLQYLNDLPCFRINDLQGSRART